MSIAQATALAAIAGSVGQASVFLLAVQVTATMPRFTRGVALIASAWLSAVLVASLVRKSVPHVGGAMSIGLFATAGFVCGAAASVEWTELNGLSVLFPASIGSAVGAFVGGWWFPIAAFKSPDELGGGERNG